MPSVQHMPQQIAHSQSVPVAESVLYYTIAGVIECRGYARCTAYATADSSQSVCPCCRVSALYRISFCGIKRAGWSEVEYATKSATLIVIQLMYLNLTTDGIIK